ncbi:MAG: hypothetical protein Q9160_002557 [Pyrenula sp. 1 TL-2023]
MSLERKNSDHLKEKLLKQLWLTNQVDDARRRGIPAESILATTPNSQRQAIIKDLKCGHPVTRLIYVTPELCERDHFRKVLQTVHEQGQLTRIAIDEAHCICEWGYDFRKAYKSLSWFKETLQQTDTVPAVRIMALTATATPRIREDIIQSLGLEPSATKCFSTATARPNIHYRVEYFNKSAPRHSSGDDIFPSLTSWLTEVANRHSLRLSSAPHTGSERREHTPMTGIVYVPTRNCADWLAHGLNSRNPRIPSLAYHAGLDHPVRAKVQYDFLNPPTHEPPNLPLNIIIATNAFGMGINAPRVRFVIHYGLPRGFEHFVQESGRAGRDGKAAASIIFYTREDRDQAALYIQRDIMGMANRKHDPRHTSAEAQMRHFEEKKESFTEMVKFCEDTTQCRHKIIEKYFAGSEGTVQTQGPIGQAVCDFACDYCMEGEGALMKRMEKGLATNEESMDFTQRESATQGDGDENGEDDVEGNDCCSGGTCHICRYGGFQPLMQAGGIENVLRAMCHQPVYLPG